MSRTKALISILTVLILIVLSGVSVWAAPGGSDPIAAQTEEPTPEPTAEPTGESTEEPTAEPTEEPIAEPTEEPIAVHPVASALAEFFAEALEVDYDMIMGYHEGGMGFGVIAQACWMSYALEGDATLLGEILAAKQSGDFGYITLPDGGTARNWGQFRKAVLGSDKARNLGAIMSGRAKIATPEPTSTTTGAAATVKPGKSDKGKGGKPDTPPGQDKDKGGGKPDTSPGKDKDKGKGGGKGKDK